MRLSSSSFALIGVVIALAGVVNACMPAEETQTRRPRTQKPSTNGNVDNESNEEGEEEESGGDPKSTSSSSGSSSPGQKPGQNENPAENPGGAIQSSKGTGGPTGQNELKSGAGLSFIINAPATAATKPRGLLVLLHGSTASNYKNFVGMMANVASTHDLIRVSVLAPNGQGWNEGNQQNAAELLHTTIQNDVLKKYDVDLSRIYFSGQSSGGGFLSSHFVPLHGKDYRGGAFLQCGAAPPFQTFSPDAATKEGFKLHFEITTGDTIWPQSYANAVNVYTNAGMSLTKDNTKTGGHCQFDQQQVIVDHIAAMLPR